MKILLDECVPVDFRHCLTNHEVHTAEWAGFKGLKNGLLLQAAEAGGYEVLVTLDQGLPHQQDLRGRKLAFIVIRARTSQMEDLLPARDAISRILEAIRPGAVTLVVGRL